MKELKSFILEKSGASVRADDLKDIIYDSAKDLSGFERWDKMWASSDLEDADIEELDSSQAYKAATKKGAENVIVWMMDSRPYSKFDTRVLAITVGQEAICANESYETLRDLKRSFRLLEKNATHAYLITGLKLVTGYEIHGSDEAHLFLDFDEDELYKDFKTAKRQADKLFNKLVDAYIEDVNERTRLEGEPRSITRNDLDINISDYDNGFMTYYASFTDPETDTVGEIEVVRA